MSFDYATLNIVNGDISFLFISNLFALADRPNFLTKNYDQDEIAYTIVKRSYNSQSLTDAIVNGDDAFAFASSLFKCENGLPDETYGKIDTLLRYAEITNEELMGDWALVDFTKLTSLDFETWRGDDELDLIVTFGGSYANKDAVYPLQQRFNLFLNDTPQLSLNNTNDLGDSITPSPALNTTKMSVLPTGDVSALYNDGYEVALNADGNVFATSAKPLSSFNTDIGQERVEVFANKNG